MDLRGTPGLGRVLALPAASFAAAVLGAGLALTAAPGDRRVAIAAASAAILGVYELVRAQRVLSRQRRAADDWLASATGGFVPPRYAWRAAQLCSPRNRRVLAKTLRLIEQMAYEQPVGRRRPLSLPAVREHRESVRGLAAALDSLETPVTSAGMLRVTDLVTDGTSPLWGTTRDTPLGDAISATLAILSPDDRNACAA